MARLGEEESKADDEKEVGKVVVSAENGFAHGSASWEGDVEGASQEGRGGRAVEDMRFAKVSSSSMAGYKCTEMGVQMEKGKRKRWERRRKRNATTDNESRQRVTTRHDKCLPSAPSPGCNTTQR